MSSTSLIKRIYMAKDFDKRANHLKNIHIGGSGGVTPREKILISSSSSSGNGRKNNKNNGKLNQLLKFGRRVLAPQFSTKLSNGVNPGPVVIIDNYDSFTYNLSQYLGSCGCDHIVYYNDEKTINELKSINPKAILLSPGPGRPNDSGISLDIVKQLSQECVIFGVCMGLQCIGQAFGGKIIRAPNGVMHGKVSKVFHSNMGVLHGLPNPFLAARYHSLVIDKSTCPNDLEVTAWTDDGTIMAVKHKSYNSVEGVQFHPESIVTEHGMTIIKNFIESFSPEYY